MKPEEYARLRALFDQAMELPLAERRGFVEQNMPTADTLRSELLAMLESGTDSRFVLDASLSSLLPTVKVDGRPATEPAAYPTQIGNYKVVRELGRGGMGVVYLAIRNDDVFHKTVAVKVIGPNGATPDFIERFKRERQILAGLDHPNIARILDGGDTPDGRPYYVMEYVAGFPIDEYCTRVNADVDDRVKIVIQVCDAINYLHDQAIVHRDLKPSNVLVDANGHVKLLDFGIARVQTVGGLVGSSSPDGRPTMILTPGYASPEQIEGHDVSKSSDIYSIGVILYQLLTGKLPFAGEGGRPDFVAQLSGSDPVPPSQNAQEGGSRTRRFKTDLDQVVRTALRRDPSRRYSTVATLGDELRRVLEGRPVAARPDRPLYKLRLFVDRNKVATALVVLLVAVAIAGVVLLVQGRIERVRLETREADLERLVTMLNTRVEHWDDAPPVPVPQRVADVQSASQVMTSETLRRLSARRADPGRVQRVVSGVQRFLDRADAKSAEQAPVRKQVAVTYRQVGDFELTTPSETPAHGSNAVHSYERAATIVASVAPEERAWAEAQLADLNGRLKQLGSSLDLALLLVNSTRTTPIAEVPVPPPLPASPVAKPREPVSTPSAAPPPARPNTDSPDLSAVIEQVRLATTNADRARQNVELTRTRLKASGQTLMPEIAAAMAQVDTFLQAARADIDRGNQEGAEENLGRVSYLLKKVFAAVGY